MIAKVEVFLHVDNIVSIIFVLLQKSIKDLNFHQSLAVKSAISYDIQMDESLTQSKFIAIQTLHTPQFYYKLNVRDNS